MTTDPMALRAERKRQAEEAKKAIPRFQCAAFSGNAVVEAVCRRVSSESSGNATYCSPSNCASPWRVLGEYVQAPAGPSLAKQSESVAEAITSPRIVRGMDSRGKRNLLVLREVSKELRAKKGRLQVHELVAAAAARLGKSQSGVRTFFFRALSAEEQNELLSGAENDRPKRADIKFKILLSVRQQMRDAKRPAPTKRQLARSAAPLLGMTVLSAEAYVYEALSEEQASALDLAKPTSTADKLAVLRSAAKTLAAEGITSPRQVDLAEYAASALGLTPKAARTFIARLDKSVRQSLGLGSYDTS